MATPAVAPARDPNLVRVGLIRVNPLSMALASIWAGHGRHQVLANERAMRRNRTLVETPPVAAPSLLDVMRHSDLMVLTSTGEEDCARLDDLARYGAALHTGVRVVLACRFRRIGQLRVVLQPRPYLSYGCAALKWDSRRPETTLATPANLDIATEDPEIHRLWELLWRPVVNTVPVRQISLWGWTPSTYRRT